MPAHTRGEPGCDVALAYRLVHTNPIPAGLELIVQAAAIRADARDAQVDTPDQPAFTRPLVIASK